MRLQLARLAALIAALLAVAGAIRMAAAATAGATAGEIVFRECLALRSPGRDGRSPVHRDPIEARIVAGSWSPPKVGESVALPDGSTQSWAAMAVGADGWFRAPSLSGGYAYLTLEASAPHAMLLDAAGHTMVYVNGEPRTGDPYATGWVRLPIWLRSGRNDLLFRCDRGGRFRARLLPPRAAALFDTSDTTLPDLVAGDATRSWGAVIVANTTSRPMAGLKIAASYGGSGATVGRSAVTALPPLLPLSVRKVAFRLDGADALPSHYGPTAEVALTLSYEQGKKRRLLDTAKLTLRVRQPSEAQKRTFVSDIDGSVQYYALNPAQKARDRSDRAPALFLSLHGAAVEAIGQANAYEGKTWGHLVAPTNRRPYGFDWEDWGRLDAMEVLALAQRQLHTDPRRTYLTGHSMGGHGAWHLGVTFPDRFAAVGPSAGWISFATYAGGRRSTGTTPMEQMLERATLPSDTTALARNLAQEGVYILHGGADDNVPVTQARTMSQLLGGFHHDFVYFEQPGAGHWWDVSDEPGADCVDWAPMFDFFAHHILPDDESVRQVEFATADPGVSARCHWVTIEAQTHPLQLSTVSIRYDPGRRRFVGTTSNVARLSLDLRPLRPVGSLQVDLDGQKLDAIPAAPDAVLWLGREGTAWRWLPSPPLPFLKGPECCGPFKQAFRHRVQFVYGTRGTAEENAWAFAKARYDAETFWYRGNGSIDVIADTAFDPEREPNRSVILYGNSQTNAAWGPLLVGSPVLLRPGSLRVGGRELPGTDLACLFLRPRPGRTRATVGVVGGTGLAGMRLTDRLPYFTSGVAYPDLIVLGPETLSQGAGGVRVAGFFGQDWGVESGEFVWGER